MFSLLFCDYINTVDSAFKLYANKIICVHNVYRDVKTNQYFL